jgi:hypothetical protein
LRPLVQGVYLMPSFGRYEVAAEVLEIIESEVGGRRSEERVVNR